MGGAFGGLVGVGLSLSRLLFSIVRLSRLLFSIVAVLKYYQLPFFIYVELARNKRCKSHAKEELM